MKHLIIFTFGLAITVPAIAQEITFDLMHTKQNCQHTGYQPTFCEMNADIDDATKLSDMVPKINAQIDRAINAPDPTLAHIFIAYLSFSNRLIHSKLCEALQKGVHIRIVLDSGSASSIDSMLSNNACKGVTNLPRFSQLGGLTSSPWRLHHNKFLYVDPGTGEGVNINASSGNLSAFGTSLHEDHWIMMTAPKHSNLIKTHLCVMQALDETTNYADSIGGHDGTNDKRVANKYIASLTKCYAQNNVIPMDQPEMAIAKEKVAMLFSPNANDEVFTVFNNEIRTVEKTGSNGYIYIAIQHFLDNGIGNALARASNAGVDVRIIMDDDVVTNKGEVQGAENFLKRLKQQAPRIQIRYIETNRNAGGNGQMMHNKFAILNGKRVFSGAGQYTGAALRKNWENFVLTQVPTLTKKYGEYFKELWDESVDEDYVRRQLQYNEDITNTHQQPPITFTSAEKTYHKRFLDLLGGEN